MADARQCAKWTMAYLTWGIGKCVFLNWFRQDLQNRYWVILLAVARNRGSRLTSITATSTFYQRCKAYMPPPSTNFDKHHQARHRFGSGGFTEAWLNVAKVSREYFLQLWNSALGLRFLFAQQCSFTFKSVWPNLTSGVRRAEDGNLYQSKLPGFVPSITHSICRVQDHTSTSILMEVFSTGGIFYIATSFVVEYFVERRPVESSRNRMIYFWNSMAWLIEPYGILAQTSQLAYVSSKVQLFIAVQMSRT